MSSFYHTSDFPQCFVIDINADSSNVSEESDCSVNSLAVSEKRKLSENYCSAPRNIGFMGGSESVIAAICKFSLFHNN